MKLDSRSMRYLTSEDWRVLTAVEMGSRNHEVVPTPLITQISGLRGGSGVQKSISNLAKIGLISRVPNAKYDGYRLTYGGLDYLALNAYSKKSVVYSIGNQIGVGKESDIFVVASSTGQQHVLKIHRLGRISFRNVKATRDYLRNRSSGSWMYMSRLAATKEHAFMCALHECGFPVPKPLGQNRHTVLMELVDAFPLRQIASVPDPAALYADLMALILRLAQYGLIHGDFNEFNLLILESKVSTAETTQSSASASTSASVPSKDSTLEETRQQGISQEEQPQQQLKLTPILIDFPQTLSINHVNAEFYFNRDVNCIKTFFQKKFRFVADESGPTFQEALEQLKKPLEDGSLAPRLDVKVEATGFSKKMAKELEKYMKEVGVDGDGGAERGSDDEDGDIEIEEDDLEEEEEQEQEQAIDHGQESSQRVI